MIARASDDGHGTPKRYARQTYAALVGSSVTRLPSKQAQTAAVEERRAHPQVATAAFSLSPRITNSVWGSFA